MHNNDSKPTAIAYIAGGERYPCINGTLMLYQKECGVLLVAKINGLPRSDNGFFAFHIHEGDSCCGKDFSGADGHFNPTATVHPRHAGDLPPLLSCGGRAYMQVLTDRFGVDDVIGRTVIIHSDPDDFRTQPSGNPGKMIACGVIRRH